MAKPLPDLVEPAHAAAQQRHYRVKVSQAQFPRLMEILEGVPQDVDIELRFFTEPETGFPAFQLRYRCDLGLICQRTLEPYLEPVDQTLTAVLIPSEGAAQIVPEGYEPWLLERHKLDPWRLIEDELMLSVPLVPRKPGEPLAWADRDIACDDEKKDENPFAALKTMMSDAGKKH
jgi:uncharacterized protein